MRLPQVQAKIDIQGLIDELVKQTPEASKKIASQLENLQEKYEKEKVRYDAIATLYQRVIEDSLPYTFAKLETEIQARQIRKSQRDADRNIEKGIKDLNENQVILGIARIAGLPNEIPENIPEEERKRYLEKLKMQMLRFEQGLRDGSLTPSLINKKIDSATNDAVYDFMQNLFDIPSQIIPQIQQKLDEIFNPDPDTNPDKVNIVEISKKIRDAVVKNQNKTKTKNKKKDGFIKWFLKGF